MCAESSYSATLQISLVCQFLIVFVDFSPIAYATINGLILLSCFPISSFYYFYLHFYIIRKCNIYVFCFQECSYLILALDLKLNILHAYCQSFLLKLSVISFLNEAYLTLLQERLMSAVLSELLNVDSYFSIALIFERYLSSYKILGS